MFFFLVLYVLSIIGAVVVAKDRRRWVAVPLALFIPILGYLFALCLKARCPHCLEYYTPGAKVCSHCGRDIDAGTVKVRGW